jgi:hypothetical protein
MSVSIIDPAETKQYDRHELITVQWHQLSQFAAQTRPAILGKLTSTTQSERASERGFGRCSACASLNQHVAVIKKKL